MDQIDVYSGCGGAVWNRNSTIYLFKYMYNTTNNLELVTQLFIEAAKITLKVFESLVVNLWLERMLIQLEIDLKWINE